jgi:predicted phosphodiesterase
MKIALGSDLHLEFGSLVLNNEENAKVLVLSGDICVERDLDNWDLTKYESGFSRKKSDDIHLFFQHVNEQFEYVIYVMGNHEHYHGDFAYTYNELSRKLRYLKNVYVLEKQILKVDDVTFIAGTLWTDMNKDDPLTLKAIKDMMNDFYVVKNSNRKIKKNIPVYKKDANGKSVVDKNGYLIQDGFVESEIDATFSPEDARNEHQKMLDYINIVTSEKHDEKFVVCGHHAPSKKSTHPRYAHETLMNGGYSSDLSDFILDRPQIKLWTHGHTHDVFDYEIGDCRIVCNPRGYHKHEERAEHFKLKYIDV